MALLIALLHALAATVCGVFGLGVTLWMAGALYFDVGRGSVLGKVLAWGWTVAVAVAFVTWHPWWQPFVLLLLVFALFATWWFSQKPSNVRDWEPNFSQLARVELDGDLVTIHNVRNTEYRSLQDYTVKYETRSYHLSRLDGVDLVVIFWGSGRICHPLLIFDFDEEGRIAVSIEVRYRKGQKYGFFRSLYRQQELAYVYTDERDAILKRTMHSYKHDVYLYRIHARADEIQKVFLEYVVNTNNLVDRPRWYNGITTNCTTSFYRQRDVDLDWDLRWLLNGQLDHMVYDHGRLDISIPFAELKAQSKINDIANAAPVEGFGDYVRERLPLYSEKQNSG